MKRNAALILIKERLPVLAVAAVIIIAAFVAPRLLQHKQNSALSPSRSGEKSVQQPGADIAGFRRDCVEKRSAGPACASVEAIKKTYNLDVLMLLEEDKSKLLMTARRIARGDLMTEGEYERCLQEGECLPVPRLGNNKPDSAKGAEIRKKFWRLVDDSRMTPEICDMLDLCRTLLKTGVINESQLTGL